MILKGKIRVVVVVVVVLVVKVWRKKWRRINGLKRCGMAVFF